MSILRRIFGLSRKSKIRLIGFILLLLIYAYYIWYPSVIRYKDFGIYIPQGYSVHGIDVSRYQGDIIWQEVEQMSSAGMSLDFAFIKATEGANYVDPLFKKNWRNIKKTQMLRGAYHFYRADVEPLKQANHFLKTVRFKSGDLAPVLDVETLDGSSPEELKKSVLQCLKYIENRMGTKPILYCNIDFQKRFFSGQEFRNFPIWIAHYNRSTAPRTDQPWEFWQHSETGNVNSIKNKVDFNVFNGSPKQLKSLLIP